MTRIAMNVQLEPMTLWRTNHIHAANCGIYRRDTDISFFVRALL